MKMILHTRQPLLHVSQRGVPWIPPKTTVITFGTFDLCHVGHVRALKRASALGDRLVVGVSSDALNRAKKNKDAVYSEQERMEIIGSLRFVDETFLEESLEAKADYIKTYGATVLVMGDDWKEI